MSFNIEIFLRAASVAIIFSKSLLNLVYFSAHFGVDKAITKKKFCFVSFEGGKNSYLLRVSVNQKRRKVAHVPLSYRALCGVACLG
jgi:hypothetical protein